MQDLHREPQSAVQAFYRDYFSSSNRPRVYLAGPIKGLQYDDAVAWRDRAAQALAPEIIAFSPMRGKSALRNTEVLGAEYVDRDGSLVMATPAAIYGRDYNDVRNADLVIAYLLGAEAVSIGTVTEVAWCHAYRIPLVIVEEPGGLHWHPFITQPALTVVQTVDDAIRVARSVLLP